MHSVNVPIIATFCPFSLQHQRYPEFAVDSHWTGKGFPSAIRSSKLE